MVKTTFVWVSFLEENQKLLTYQMFRGFPQAQNMVTFYLLMLCFLTILCLHAACACFFWNKVHHDRRAECGDSV